MRISNKIKKLIFTEKSTSLKELDTYVFNVSVGLTKDAIKSEIENLFGVKVDKVRTLLNPSKPKMAFSLRRNKARKNIRVGRFKKAYVRLKQGQSIIVAPNKEGN